jgi:hypothetical protein
MSDNKPIIIAGTSPDKSLALVSALQTAWNQYAHDLNPADQKRALRILVENNYPDLPCFSTLQHALIEETQKASVSGGAILTYFDESSHRRKIVMVKAGAHYGHDGDRYMIPGGFTNLTSREGSIFVPADETRPETIFMSTAREIEEELRHIDGSSLIAVDPARLKLIDSDTLSFSSGEKRIVTGFVLSLTQGEVLRIQHHIAMINKDEDYRDKVSAHTINDQTGFPEVHSLEILEFDDFLSGRKELLHADQLPLLQKAKCFFDKQDAKFMCEKCGTKSAPTP